MSDPNDSRPDSDEEIIVGLPEASLDDLIAGLEASWQTPATEEAPDAEAPETATEDESADEVVTLSADEPAVAPEVEPEPVAPTEAAAVVAAPEPTQASSAPEPGGPERRGAVRHEAHEFKTELRLAVAGFPMRLVNLSRTGLLAETNQRLCPGRTVDVFLRYGGVRKVLRATVIRSTMHAVAPNPVFRAALQFEDELALQDTEL